jgi:hypothetical protein
LSAGALAGCSAAVYLRFTKLLWLLANKQWAPGFSASFKSFRRLNPLEFIFSRDFCHIFNRE